MRGGGTQPLVEQLVDQKTALQLLDHCSTPARPPGRPKHCSTTARLLLDTWSTEGLAKRCWPELAADLCGRLFANQSWPLTRVVSFFDGV